MKIFASGVGEHAADGFDESRPLISWEPPGRRGPLAVGAQYSPASKSAAIPGLAVAFVIGEGLLVAHL